MSKAAKWIIAILIGLLALAAIAAAGVWVYTHWNSGGWMMSERGLRSWDNDRDFPGRILPWRGMHPNMMPFGGMHGGWFGGFFPLGMLFGGLLQLGILALVIYGIYALVRGLSRPRQEAVSTQVVAPAAAASQAAPLTHACANCGFAVQEGWKHCPNCGQEQASF